MNELTVEYDYDNLRARHLAKATLASLTQKQGRDEFTKNHLRSCLAYQVRALRKASDLTQEELAKLTGMAQPSIARIENPLRPSNHSLRSLLRIASALDVSLSIEFCSTASLVVRDLDFNPDTFKVTPYAQDLNLQQHAESARIRLAVIDQS